MHLIALCRTLRRDRPNHHILIEGRGTARFVSMAKTSNPFPLIIEDTWGSPYVLDAPGYGDRVVVELWEVDAEKLFQLDLFERISTHHFIRRLIRVKTEKVVDILADMYLSSYFNSERIMAGGYEGYSEYTAKLAAQYVPLSERPEYAGAAYRRCFSCE